MDGWRKASKKIKNEIEPVSSSAVCSIIIIIVVPGTFSYFQKCVDTQFSLTYVTQMLSQTKDIYTS
jgi:hypothetical protein